MWWFWPINGGERVWLGRRSVYMQKMAREKLNVVIRATDLNGVVGMVTEAVGHAYWSIAPSSVWWWSMSVRGGVCE